MILLLVVSAGPAAATTIVPMDDAALVRSSAVIAVGSIRRLQSLALADGSVVTEAVLALEQRFKGRTRGTKLVVTEPGGIVADREVRVFGVPEFTAGERVLLFLKRTTAGRLRVNGLALGKFSLRDDTAVRGAPVAAERPLEAFLARIAALADGQEGDTGGNGRVPGAAVATGPTIARFTFLGSPPHRWPDSSVALRTANADTALGATVSARIVTNALAAWSTAPGVDLQLSNVGSTSTGPSIAGGICDGRSVIQFNDPRSEVADLVGCTGVVAVGGFCQRGGNTTVGGVSFGNIEEADITVNNRAGACFGETGLSEVITHELGHAIGLGHSSNDANEPNPRLRDATMFFLAHFDGRGASLRADDRDGVRAIYPAAPTGPDADRDGVPDASDLCPDTPAGEAVEAGGCSCSQAGHPSCDDKNACTDDSCAAATAACVHTPIVCSDDGDPCTVEGCNSLTGCTHVSADTDGDGICDAQDPCPRLANAPATDANGDGIGDACECAEPAPGVCLPGRGRVATRCLVEWRPLDGVAASSARRQAGLVCRDGDPACDHDAVVGQCTFHVLLCLNLRDPRFPGCTPVGTTAVLAITTHPGRLLDAVDRANARTVAAALAIDHSRPDQCSAPVDLIVPLERDRPGTRTVSVRTRSVTGHGRARLALRCLP